MRTAIGSARGLGSAREGVGHWKMQRLTAIGGVVLGLWFVVSAISLAGADFAAVRSWLGRPLNATLMLLLVVSMYWHAKLGLQVVIEDYVHHEGVKVVSLVAIVLLAFLLGGLSVVSILKVALGS
jgi:succinate dehydrogenase / fumarate reductase membrane anchor subunit